MLNLYTHSWEYAELAESCWTPELRSWKIEIGAPFWRACREIQREALFQVCRVSNLICLRANLLLSPQKQEILSPRMLCIPQMTCSMADPLPCWLGHYQARPFCIIAMLCGVIIPHEFPWHSCPLTTSSAMGTCTALKAGGSFASVGDRKSLKHGSGVRLEPKWARVALWVTDRPCQKQLFAFKSVSGEHELGTSPASTARLHGPCKYIPPGQYKDTPT